MCLSLWRGIGQGGGAAMLAFNSAYGKVIADYEVEVHQPLLCAPLRL